MPNRLANLLLVATMVAALAGCTSAVFPESLSTAEGPTGPASRPGDADDPSLPDSGSAIRAAGGEGPTPAPVGNNGMDKEPASRDRVEVYNFTATVTGATAFEDTLEAPAGTAWLGFQIRRSSDLCAGVVRVTVFDPNGKQVGADNLDCAPLAGVGCVARVTCQLRGFEATAGTYRLVYDVVGLVHLSVKGFAYPG